MKTTTLRGVDEDLSDALKRAADDANQSVNQFILDRLNSDLGLSKPKQYTQVFHDLDDLFGSWTEQEYRDVEQRISARRRIDPELWKRALCSSTRISTRWPYEENRR